MILCFAKYAVAAVIRTDSLSARLIKLCEERSDGLSLTFYSL